MLSMLLQNVTNLMTVSCLPAMEASIAVKHSENALSNVGMTQNLSGVINAMTITISNFSYLPRARFLPR